MKSLPRPRFASSRSASHQDPAHAEDGSGRSSTWSPRPGRRAPRHWPRGTTHGIETKGLEVRFGVEHVAKRSGWPSGASQDQAMLSDRLLG